ncbi:cystathionine beta-lyase [Halalkalibacillus sediminis]|uniref:cysteine-S-conjugate beta-lyase n=1 Tax=Halalkalibacillus sediminis TaxID=2018042 RepID=A0A2I0QV06_9BACI|nr:PatB family C-S lyase [Halalkalibacillus sediminis]PKR78124.1 cystathionine beta-lyase [Halalkalibacillus sediminis]
MKYDFNQTINRENTRAVKYDFREKLFGSNEILPMWVADMDFASTPFLQEAIIERARHNVYGYTTYDKELLETVQSWLKERHQFDVSTDLISLSPGVIPSLHALVQSFTEEGDQIVIQPPVYPPFFSVVKEHNREIVENPLIEKDHHYEINFTQLEEQFKNGAKAFILCSPHNPVGRVWTQDEVQRMVDLCEKYDVYLFSDEIHADIIFSEGRHYPSETLSNNSESNKRIFTLMAPSKTFNIAGLQGSYVISPNQKSKEIFDKQLGRQGFVVLNTFAYTAMEAVYKHGEDWLEQLNEQLQENRDLVHRKLQESKTSVKAFDSEGTYLIWLDFRDTGLSHDEISRKLKEDAKVGLNDGKSFGDQGECFMRLNIASPSSVVEEAIDRIIQAFKK